MGGVVFFSELAPLFEFAVVFPILLDLFVISGFRLAGCLSSQDQTEAPGAVRR